MSWKCEKCGEEFNYDEIILLCGDIIVEDEEHGGSGDIDRALCGCCYDEEFED